jgi:hypothetical protein
MIFDAKDRAVFGRLADVLIPAGEIMLSASAAGVAGPWLDAVLSARPDLAAPLKALLLKAQDQPPDTFLEQLRASDAQEFGALGEITAAAYFMNPDIQQAIGYGGQGPRPIDQRPDYLDDGLLEPVLRRGPIYRPTPVTTDHEKRK